MEDVLKCYSAALGCTPRQAADQLLNPAGLESVLARPKNYTLYQGADIALQAAVLAHGIAEGQHFIDGNKRTAWTALRSFLLMNGRDVQASQRERAAWILALSEGNTPAQLADQIRAHLIDSE